uniref:Uncharacterized protein n=1 Tax=Anopheles culicifacies TaxID=139723 RepID=A0A182MH72_9DIPT
MHPQCDQEPSSPNVNGPSIRAQQVKRNRHVPFHHHASREFAVTHHQTTSTFCGAKVKLRNHNGVDHSSVLPSAVFTFSFTHNFMRTQTYTNLASTHLCIHALKRTIERLTILPLNHTHTLTRRSHVVRHCGDGVGKQATSNGLTGEEISCDPTRPDLEQLRFVVVVVELRLHRVYVRLEPQHLQLDACILPLKLGYLLVQCQYVLGGDAGPIVRLDTSRRIGSAGESSTNVAGRVGGGWVRYQRPGGTVGWRSGMIRGRTRTAMVRHGCWTTDTDHTRHSVMAGMAETGEWHTAGRQDAAQRGRGLCRGWRRWSDQKRTGTTRHQAALNALADLDATGPRPPRTPVSESPYRGFLLDGACPGPCAVGQLATVRCVLNVPSTCPLPSQPGVGQVNGSNLPAAACAMAAFACSIVPPFSRMCILLRNAIGHPDALWEI